VSAPAVRPRGIARLGSDIRAMLREQTTYHELLRALARRDLLVRYRQAALGIGWAVLSPLLHMLVFTLIFTRVVRLDTGLPYPVFAYAGLLPWALFATSLRTATTSLTSNTALVTKVHFAREVLPFSAMLVALADFVVASSILIVLMVWFKVGVTWTVLALPLVVAVQLAFTAGLALLLAMANLFWRDVRHVVEVLLTVWKFLTSVVYPVELIGGKLGPLLQLNPMTPIIDGYRAVLLRGELPAAGPFAGAAITAVAVLLVGWLVFHRAEPRFAENI